MKKSFHVTPFHRSRDTIVNTLTRARNKNNVHSLMELDVTDARSLVKSSRKQARVSFKAWLIQQIAKTAAEFPEVHSMRKGRKLYSFDQVDIAIVLEREVSGEKQAIPAVLRCAERKSCSEITAEIETCKCEDVSESNLVMGRKKTSLLTRLFIALPVWIQRWLFNFILNRPQWAQPMMGSIMVSNLSPFSNLDVWGIPLSMHPVTFLPGPILEKPVVRKGEVQIRQIMNLTVTFDHDIVDGAQFGRFLRKFTRRLEKPEID